MTKLHDEKKQKQFRAFIKMMHDKDDGLVIEYNWGTCPKCDGLTNKITAPKFPHLVGYYSNQCGHLFVGDIDAETDQYVHAYQKVRVLWSKEMEMIDSDK